MSSVARHSQLSRQPEDDLTPEELAALERMGGRDIEVPTDGRVLGAGDVELAGQHLREIEAAQRTDAPLAVHRKIAPRVVAAGARPRARSSHRKVTKTAAAPPGSDDNGPPRVTRWADGAR